MVCGSIIKNLKQNSIYPICFLIKVYKLYNSLNIYIDTEVLEMVDFNSEGTMSKPPKEVVALIIIEKLYNFLEADEIFTKTMLNGASLGLAVSRARLRSLYLVTHEMLNRRCKAEDQTKLKIVCMDLQHKTDTVELMESFLIILQVLDDLQLIKLDTKPVYKRHRIEEANKQHGY